MVSLVALHWSYLKFYIVCVWFCFDLGHDMIATSQAVRDLWVLGFGEDNKSGNKI